MKDPLHSTGAGLSELRRAVEGVLDELSWSPPCELGTLLDQITRRCGKRISLLPAPLPRDGAGGLVIERVHDLVIVVDQSLPSLLQEHVIMHEAAHVLFGHRGTSVGDLTRDELDELDPDVVRDAQRLVKRDGYSAVEEKVAEIAAALMWSRADRARRSVRPAARSAAVAEANARFAEALLARRPR
ncbi:hypothetical protein [Umezawaea tangerina]|uniref:IrrE N-terminal-like domain-containing protein n=1 Tax=Umezawaea tangerina TaxID=84725 RepID=A0A2T0T7D5_9PSEU|nr:hypothetical protein [Umezawaea tangerina]PRY41596.1 hypothetical protein CLV43_105354 [Umezawaea tangerina]